MASSGVWLDCGEAGEAGSNSAVVDPHGKAGQQRQDWVGPNDGMVVEQDSAPDGFDADAIFARASLVCEKEFVDFGAGGHGLLCAGSGH